MVATERKRPRLINLCYLHQGYIKRRKKGTRLQMLHKLYVRLSHHGKILAPRIQTPVSLWDGQNGLFSRKQVSSGGKCESTPAKEKQTPNSRLSKEEGTGLSFSRVRHKCRIWGRRGTVPKSRSQKGRREKAHSTSSRMQGEGETLSGVSQERGRGRKDLVE